MNAVFTGRRRSGKTTLAFWIAQHSGGGIIVYDPKREFRGWPDTFSSVDEVDAAAKRGAKVIVFHPDGDSDEEFTALGEWIIRQHEIAMAKDWDKRGFHFTLIVDEAHNIQGPNWVNPKLLQILSQNRPEILDVFLTVQSPKDAFNRIKSRISDWYIFSTNLPSDLEYLQREIGVSREDTDRIATMGDHEYAHFYFDGGRPVAEFVTNADVWYTDLELTKEEAKEMARDDREERQNELRYPLQVESEADIFRAYDRVNRRKVDDPKSKYRGRKTDREQRSGEQRGDGKKVYKIGDWQEKSA